MGAPPDDDPLALAIAPPPDETAEQREARLAAEAEAKTVSERIDEQLKTERAAQKKRRSHTVNVLLLGQSESGTCLLIVVGAPADQPMPSASRQVDDPEE